MNLSCATTAYRTHLGSSISIAAGQSAAKDKKLYQNFWQNH
ncbi:hypothetical protein ACFOEM_12580 [Paenalcaligenes hominis]